MMLNEILILLFTFNVTTRAQNILLNRFCELNNQIKIGYFLALTRLKIYIPLREHVTNLFSLACSANEEH